MISNTLADSSKTLTRQILLIEDDADIAEILSVNLADFGAKVVHESQGHSGLKRALAEGWDLIILDLGLPVVDGLHIAHKVREQSPLVPIFMVTARSAESDRVIGLDAGADDYIVKPFSVREMVARVRALFRRIEHQHTPAVTHKLAYDELELWFHSQRVCVSGNEISLTKLEFNLLFEMLSNAGKVYSRKELLQRVWGTDYQGYRHTVNSHINRIRSKIEPDPANPSYIKTVWGTGYRLG